MIACALVATGGGAHAQPTPNPAPNPAPKLTTPRVPFPHPIITEVFYAPGRNDDASGDGKRSAQGDEFIEIVNPHDKTIRLDGYVLTDRNAPSAGQLKFVFPACTLNPGQAAVVFNGLETKPQGPSGTTRAASGPNPSFGGALVFSMENDSSTVALANGGDYVCLTAPDGTVVQLVTWGEYDEVQPSALLRDDAPRVSGQSVQRKGLSGEMTPHRELDNVSFSPGVAPKG
jgi:hypothetical protein